MTKKYWFAKTGHDDKTLRIAELYESKVMCYKNNLIVCIEECQPFAFKNHSYFVKIYFAQDKLFCNNLFSIYYYVFYIRKKNHLYFIPLC